MNDEKTFGQLIKEIRLKYGMNQRDFAKLTGVSQKELSTMERGERKYPRVDLVRKIARATYSSFEELMVAAGYIDSNLYLLTDSQKNTLELMKSLQNKSYEEILDDALIRYLSANISNIYIDENDNLCYELVNEKGEKYETNNI